MTQTTEQPKENGENEPTIKAIADRLKFFFSDANIRQDGFMRKFFLGKHEGDDEPSGYIPIDVLLRFNTIKKHTKDESVVINAAKTLSDFLVVNKGEDAIGRVNPFRRDQLDDNIPLSLYIYDLPLSTSGKKTQYESSAEEIRKLFDPTYGKVTLVKLRYKKWTGDAEKENNGKKEGFKKWKNQDPIGAALVEFETEDDLKKAAADVLTSQNGSEVEPKQTLTLGGKTIKAMLLKDYIEEHKKKKDKGGEEKSPDKKREREEDPEDEKSESKAETEYKEFTLDWKPGCVIKLKELSSSCDREAILDLVVQAMNITIDEVKNQKIYADFSRGQTDGAIRFMEPSDDIKEMAAKLESGELQIAGEKVGSAYVLEGDEETKYWKDFIEFKNKQFRHKREERNSRKKRFRRK